MTKRWLSTALALVCLVPNIARGQQMRAEAPTLDEVLQSTEEHHPLIAHGIAELEAAHGTRLSSRGELDPYLEVGAQIQQGAYYEIARANLRLTQPTGIWGSEIWFGYRYGRATRGGNGSFPTYYSDQTLPGGEIQAGIRVPVFRGGRVDPRRFQVDQATLGIERMELSLAAQRLQAAIAATDAYYKWILAHDRLDIAETQLDIALRRQEFLTQNLAEGLTSEIEVVDNERMVVERQTSVVHARRTVREASIQLSLFLRDDAGQPRILTGRIHAPPPSTATALAPPDRESIASCHPRVRAYEIRRRQMEARLERARQDQAPEIDTSLSIARDLGDRVDPALAGTEIRASVELSMPLALRRERGTVQRLRAELAAIAEQQRWERDRIAADVSRLSVAIANLAEQVELERRAVALAERMAAAERERFDEGASTLLNVNLRESAVASARNGFYADARQLQAAVRGYALMLDCNAFTDARVPE